MFKAHSHSLIVCILCLLFLQGTLYSQNPTETPEVPTATPTPSPEIPIATPTPTSEVPVVTPTPEAPTATPTPEIPKPTPVEERDLVHYGDLIEIDVIGSTEFDWRGKINPEGFLTGIDYIDEPVYALCRSETQVAESIAKGFEKVLKTPQVVVKILDRSGRPVSVMYGAIRTPQRFRIQRQVFLSELITLSGGITEKANGDVQIIRPANLSCLPEKKDNAETTTAENQSQKVSAQIPGDRGSEMYTLKISDLLKGEESANPEILSGDIVTVLEAEPVYIIGGVLTPKQLNVRSGMTLSRAISSAGGAVKNADLNNVTIFRRDEGRVKTLKVSLADIKAEKAEDILLQKFDIVDVGVTGGNGRKFPPVIKIDETPDKKVSELPLQIIN